MAAGSTYTPIATTTLGSTTTSYTFTSIPSTYTDLILIITGNANAGTNPVIQFNSDTGSNYSTTYLTGNGSAASSSRQTSATSILPDYNGYMTSTSNAIIISQIMNYSNTTTYKTVLNRGNAAATGTDATVGLWRNTSAINSITILTGSSNTFSVGNTFTLYGIAAA
jgi:hypothetical protein